MDAIDFTIVGFFRSNTSLNIDGIYVYIGYTTTWRLPQDIHSRGLKAKKSVNPIPTKYIEGCNRLVSWL